MSIALIPRPSQVEIQPGTLLVAAGTGISAPGSLDDIVDRFIQDTTRESALRLRREAAGAVRITLETALPELDDLPAPMGRHPSSGGEPPEEGYVLNVSPEGILIRAVHPAGVHRGLTTLRQLLAMSPVAAGGEVALPGLAIIDRPRLAWRGLLVDVGRCYLPLDDLRTLVDMLSTIKLNALHLHLTDNWGWRIDLDDAPEATADVADAKYTHSDLEAISSYAAERFVTVIPEIEVPGHSLAVLDALPELGVVRDIEGKRVGYLDPRRPRTLPFLAGAIEHVAAVTGSKIVHIGGDEAFGMPQELYVEIVRDALAFARRGGRTAVGFQEASRAGFAPGDLAQYWIDFVDSPELIANVADALAQGAEHVPPSALAYFREAAGDLSRILEQGADVILSPTRFCYFDIPHAEQASKRERSNGGATLGLSVYTPRGLQSFYEWDTTNVVAGLPADRIAGAEAAIWGETITSLSDLQSLVTTRLYGFAEVAWASTASEWDEYRRRLRPQARVWNARGWEWYPAESVW